MSDQPPTIRTENKSYRNKMKKVAFAAEIAHRLSHRSSGSDNLRKTDDLVIAIPEGNQTTTAAFGSSVSLESYSERDTDSDVGRDRQRYREYSSMAPSDFPKTPEDSRGPEDKDLKAPEQALTLFAFRLALLEKTASKAGTLAFIWATVVILGGFSQYVSKIDFWVVTILLVTEGTRIFFRSNELEWQQAGSRSAFSFFDIGSSFAQKSGRVFSDLIHGSPVSRSSSDENRREQSPWNGQSRMSPFPTPQTARARSPSSPSQISQSKRARRMAAGLKAKSARRTWSASVLPLLPYTQLISAKGMATTLYICQVFSAIVCLSLSVWRLVWHQFTNGDPTTAPDLKVNVEYSLWAFYIMSLLEAFVFLIERTYWEYKINYQQLFAKVNSNAGLRDDCTETIRSFFYEVYSKSLATSVFAGMDMDLVSYSMELLQKNDEKEVLGGTKILLSFIEPSHYRFRGDTLRRIGITPGVIDRLVEMLAWHHKDDQVDIRVNAAALVKALVSSTRNGSRVVAVSGSLENVMSLFQWDDVDRFFHDEGKTGTPLPKAVLELRTYGLGILKSLALDHAHCLRIGETRGLLATLVEFTDIHTRNSNDADWKNMRQSLQLLSMLAGTTGTSGTILRPAIANVVSTIPHLRDILHYRGRSEGLQELAVDVLKDLALDKDCRKIIGSTGGVISNLMMLFTRRSLRSMDLGYRSTPNTGIPTEGDAEKETLAKKAGEALTRLALQNEENCIRILRTRFKSLDALTILLQILVIEENEWLGIYAARILRATFIYIPSSKQVEVSKHIHFILERVVFCTNKRVQEAAMGLGVVVPIVSDEEFERIFENGKVTRDDLAAVLVKCLHHVPSTTRRPRVRRYSLEFIRELLNRDERFKPLFSSRDLPSVLIGMLDNISDVENYLLFSGGRALTRHKEDMESIVAKVLRVFGDDIGLKDDTVKPMWSV